MMTFAELAALLRSYRKRTPAELRARADELEEVATDLGRSPKERRLAQVHLGALEHVLCERSDEESTDV